MGMGMSGWEWEGMGKFKKNGMGLGREWEWLHGNGREWELKYYSCTPLLCTNSAVRALCVFLCVFCSVLCCVCCCSACILHCVFYSLFLNSNYFALIKLYKYEFNCWYRKKAYYLDALLFLNFNSNNKF